MNCYINNRAQSLEDTRVFVFIRYNPYSKKI